MGAKYPQLPVLHRIVAVAERPSQGDRAVLHLLGYSDDPASLKGPQKSVILTGEQRRFVGVDVFTRLAILRFIF